MKKDDIDAIYGITQIPEYIFELKPAPPLTLKEKILGLLVDLKDIGLDLLILSLFISFVCFVVFINVKIYFG